MLVLRIFPCQEKVAGLKSFGFSVKSRFGFASERYYLAVCLVELLRRPLNVIFQVLFRHLQH